MSTMFEVVSHKVHSSIQVSHSMGTECGKAAEGTALTAMVWPGRPADLPKFHRDCFACGWNAF